MIIAGNKKTAGRSGRFSEVPWFWMAGGIYGFTFLVSLLVLAELVSV